MKKVQIKKVKKSSSKKDMSVSELASMVAHGFLETQTTLRGEIQDAEERLGGRINMLDHKVDRIQDSVNELSYDSRKVRTRVENLEFKVFGSIQEP